MTRINAFVHPKSCQRESLHFSSMYFNFILFSDSLLALRVLTVPDNPGDAVPKHRNINGILILIM